MDYIKIRFGNDFDQLVPKFEKTVEEMFRSMSPMFTLSERAWRPQTDICETSEEIFILAEMAGVSKDDLLVEVNSKAVRIYGKRVGMPVKGNVTYRLAEIQYGRFERVLFLPALIDTDKVTASFSDGFLKIRFAKLVCETHKIPISD